MPDSPTPQDVGVAGGHRSRRRIGAGVAVIAASAAAVGIVLGAGPSSSRGASKPAKASGAATVARRDLVSTDTESGTLGYADPQTVFNRLSGTITSLPSVGKVIDPGQTLYGVDSNPVVLFNGTSPAYRDLTAGVGNGPDVFELKQNLKALGFDPDHQITVDQTFDAATTAAVERWQASIGQTQTGTVMLGQIVFLPGPQRITHVETVLGSTGGASSASASGSAAGASLAVAAPRAEFVDLTTTKPSRTKTPTTSATTCPKSLTTPTSGKGASAAVIAATRKKIAALCREQTTATAQQTLAALIALLNAETAQLKRSNASASAGTGSSSARTGTAGATAATTGRSSSSGSGGGTSSSGGSSSSASAASGGSAATGGSSASGGGTAQAILQTTSTRLVVTVQLDATKQSEATVGGRVTVQLPGGDTVDGRITAVSPVAQSASSSSSSSGSGGGGSSSSAPSSTVPVSVTLSGPENGRGLDQAAVSVSFAQARARRVLSVPVTALLATAGGGYAVQEAAAPHRLVAVSAGLFAAGFVQVSGAGIFPGLLVTDSQG